MVNKLVSEARVLWRNKEYLLRYWDLETFESLEYAKCKKAAGVCFYGDKLIIVRNRKAGWNLAGGHIEKGEELADTFIREVKEETNMKVLSFAPVGVQEVTTPSGRVEYQLRYCAMVEPYGDFYEDPAGSVVEIKHIQHRDYKKYFDWGEIGERIMKRALLLKEKLLKPEDAEGAGDKHHLPE